MHAYDGVQHNRQLSTVAHNCHGKINFITAKSISFTAKSISSRQNHFAHGKINFITAKLFCSRQNQFHHGKIILLTAKSISSRQNHFAHGRINFITAKSFCSILKQFFNIELEQKFVPSCRMSYILAHVQAVLATKVQRTEYRQLMRAIRRIETNGLFSLKTYYDQHCRGSFNFLFCL